MSYRSFVYLCVYYRYRLVDHVRYLDAWIKRLDLPNKITLVGQDWGAAVALHWANTNRHRIQGLAYYEAALNIAPSWDGMTSLGQPPDYCRSPNTAST